MRPLIEGFNRVFIVMHGTDKQFKALTEDTYRTEFKTEGELVDQVSGFSPLFGPLFSNIKDGLHGFTHFGVEHLSRMANGTDIGPYYSDADATDLLKFVTMMTLIAAVAVAHYLELPDEHESSTKLLDEFLGITGTELPLR
jgi:hypothetical protein